MTQDYTIDVPFIAEAESEARLLGHVYVGNEHLLIAIAAKAEDDASQLLARHGLSANALRAATARTLGESTATTSAPKTLRLSHRTQIAIGDALTLSHVRAASSQSVSDAERDDRDHGMEWLRAVLNAERTSKSTVSALLETFGLTSAALLRELPTSRA